MCTNHIENRLNILSKPYPTFLLNKYKMNLLSLLYQTYHIRAFNENFIRANLPSTYVIHSWIVAFQIFDYILDEVSQTVLSCPRTCKYSFDKFSGRLFSVSAVVSSCLPRDLLACVSLLQHSLSPQPWDFWWPSSVLLPSPAEGDWDSLVAAVDCTSWANVSFPCSSAINTIYYHLYTWYIVLQNS